MQHAMWPLGGILILAACFVEPAAGVGVSQGMTTRALANPIRKVVTMLQAMSKKVEEEGAKEKKLYDKFMCFCESGMKDLDTTISDGEAKMPALGSDIEASEGRQSQLKGDIEKAQVDRDSAKASIAEATSVRKQDADSFASEKAESDANIAAVSKAIMAINKGLTAGFLQTGAAQVLRQMLSRGLDMPDSDHEMLASFLSISRDAANTPESNEIVGILSQIKETMVKNLAQATSEEAAAIKSFEESVAAKTKEVEALQAMIETKMEQVSELGVKIVRLKEDLSDTESSLQEDSTFKKGLAKSCSTKAAEWAERQKVRAQEMVALADTIKVLNDDDALELFKKTLPSAGASFMQVQVRASTMRNQALSLLRAARHGNTGIDFLVLAITGKKALGQGGFEKVVKMCDSMIEVLKKEQQDDDHKKEYCTAQFDFADDKAKALKISLGEQNNAIATAKDSITTISEEIAKLEAGIVALDKSVAEATDQRKKENSEYKELIASDSAAKELLGFAKNRLNKFYNPKLHKAAPKVELSAQDRIVAGMTGTEPPTPPPGGIANTGIEMPALVQLSSGSHRQAPETWKGGYGKKSEQSTGVIAMIDLLIKDLDKEMTVAETEEKDAQADYEVMMEDSAKKRTADANALTEKGEAKADLEAALEAHKTAKADTSAELMATLKHTHALHQECDWLLQNFAVRKEARAGEIDSLGRAKAVLSGADYSLVQLGVRSRLGHLRATAMLP